MQQVHRNYNITTIRTPKGYDDKFNYYSITCEQGIVNESQLLDDEDFQFTFKSKIVAAKERIDDWLLTVLK